jgi:hypothetical protein
LHHTQYPNFYSNCITIMLQALNISTRNSSSADATNCLDALPCDVLQQIADSYLNPAERSRLSSCSKRLNQLLPPLLRIKIVSATSASLSKQQGNGGNFQSLLPAFFVTPADCESKDDEYDNSVSYNHCSGTDGPSCVKDRCLLSTDNLVFGQRYYFWTFDYQRGNKVYLGRHTRHGLKDQHTGMFQYSYSMGLRPRSPNQTWEVVSDGSEEDGDVVMWGEDVGLSVGGTNPRPRLPDSNDRKLLSCLPFQESMTDNNDNNPANAIDNSGSSWCVVQEKWGPSERMQLLPIEQFVPGPDVLEKVLNINAIAEACDEGEYLLHSPESLRDGVATCDGFHVIVNFDFWVKKGVMHFFAPVLPFALGIPILETDYCRNRKSNTHGSSKSPIANLLDIKSARWGCLIYYMAVAADVTEGKTLDMDRFLRRVTDHEDHSVQINERMDFVYIDVKGKKVNQQSTELPRQIISNSTAMAPGSNCCWSFVLSW